MGCTSRYVRTIWRVPATTTKSIFMLVINSLASSGDLLHFNVLGQHMVVLDSPQAMFELLEKRSANTSDRQRSPLIDLSVFVFFLRLNQQ